MVYLFSVNSIDNGCSCTYFNVIRYHVFGSYFDVICYFCVLQLHLAENYWSAIALLFSCGTFLNVATLHVLPSILVSCFPYFEYSYNIQYFTLKKVELY